MDLKDVERLIKSNNKSIESYKRNMESVLRQTEVSSFISIDKKYNEDQAYCPKLFGVTVLFPQNVKDAILKRIKGLIAELKQENQKLLNDALNATESLKELIKE